MWRVAKFPFFCGIACIAVTALKRIFQPVKKFAPPPAKYFPARQKNARLIAWCAHFLFPKKSVFGVFYLTDCICRSANFSGSENKTDPSCEMKETVSVLAFSGPSIENLVKALWKTELFGTRK